MNAYFVNYISYGEEVGFSYNNVTKYDTLDDAKKGYHGLLNKYIGYEKFSQLSVVLYDAKNNIIARENWTAEA